MASNIFKTLSEINVNGHTEKKNGLTYLSWAWAWAEVKKAFPSANYKIYENADGWNYFTDGRTAWVKTGVLIEGQEHIEYLPVMDYKNKSIPLENITSFDVNKAIQRSLTKACARHGLGLYIYAGEDLPESAEERKAMEADLDKVITEKEVAVLKNMLHDDQIAWALKAYQIKDLTEMTGRMKGDLMTRLNAQRKKNGSTSAA